MPQREPRRVPSSDRDAAAAIALLRADFLPEEEVAERLEANGSAERLLRELAGTSKLSSTRDPSVTLRLFEESPPPEEAPGTGPTEGAPVDPEQLLRAAAEDLRSYAQEGIDVLTPVHPRYPQNLHEVHDRPPILFVRGPLTPADQRSIAVIGTRYPSDTGVRDAEVISAEAARAGYTVISGLAKGIDTAAHEAALEAGGRTVAVIGTGLRRVYPAENAQLQERIGEEGAVVSQFWPDAPPARENFPRRNALMSGLSLGTVVVDAGEVSGTRIQARLALAHGRPVLLHRRLLQRAWGRDLAERGGAYVVDGAPEVLTVLDRLHSRGLQS